MNPRSLPNNMCCPFMETEGVRGIPYNAAVQEFDLNKIVLSWVFSKV